MKREEKKEGKRKEDVLIRKQQKEKGRCDGNDQTSEALLTHIFPFLLLLPKNSSKKQTL